MIQRVSVNFGMMKSKIIIHNQTDYSDAEALQYASKVLHSPYANGFWMFEDNTKVQKIKRDKGYTLYVYK